MHAYFIMRTRFQFKMQIKFMIYKCHMTHLEIIYRSFVRSLPCRCAHEMSWNVGDISIRAKIILITIWENDSKTPCVSRISMCKWANRLNRTSDELLKHVILAITKVHFPCNVSALCFMTFSYVETINSRCMAWTSTLVFITRIFVSVHWKNIREKEIMNAFSNTYKMLLIFCAKGDFRENSE